MVAFMYRIPSGIPGNTNRNEHLLAEVGILMATKAPQAYGQPVVLDATTRQVRAVQAGDTAEDVIGFNIRPYPTTPGSYTSQGLGSVTPMASGPVDVMKRGYMMVQLNGATAAGKGDKVHVRIAAASAGKPIGGLEAVADGANTIELVNAEFMGPSDAQGNTEISYNL